MSRGPLGDLSVVISNSSGASILLAPGVQHFLDIQEQSDFGQH
jgi:hypothetical protein